MENITRRELFAANALSGLIVSTQMAMAQMTRIPNNSETHDKIRKGMIMDAFAMADMMETFSDNGVFQEQLDLENS